jgi:hypothetical protein
MDVMGSESAYGGAMNQQIGTALKGEIVLRCTSRYCSRDSEVYCTKLEQHGNAKRRFRRTVLQVDLAGACYVSNPK